MWLTNKWPTGILKKYLLSKYKYLDWTEQYLYSFVGVWYDTTDSFKSKNLQRPVLTYAAGTSRPDATKTSRILYKIEV